VSVHDDLRALRTLLEEPEHWIQGYGADLLGPHCVVSGFRVISPDDYRRECAVCEAVALAAGIEVYSEGELQVEVGRWNDSHTHAEVLALLDEAIAATASEELPQEGGAASTSAEARGNPAGAVSTERGWAAGALLTGQCRLGPSQAPADAEVPARRSRRRAGEPFDRTRSYAPEPSRPPLTPLVGARRQSLTTESAGQGALGTMPTADGARDHAC
jgi:hypothetical protein